MIKNFIFRNEKTNKKNKIKSKEECIEESKEITKKWEDKIECDKKNRDEIMDSMCVYYRIDEIGEESIIIDDLKENSYESDIYYKIVNNDIIDKIKKYNEIIKESYENKILKIKTLIYEECEKELERFINNEKYEIDDEYIVQMMNNICEIEEQENEIENYIKELKNNVNGILINLPNTRDIFYFMTKRKKSYFVMLYQYIYSIQFPKSFEKNFGEKNKYLKQLQ